MIEKIKERYRDGVVCIVGQGPSITEGEWDDDGTLKKLANGETIRPDEANKLIDGSPRCRSVENLPGDKWTLNGGWTAHKSTLGFHMDSMKLVAEDKQRTAQFNDMYKKAFHAPIPIFSSVTFEEYPNIIRYPIEEIVEYFGEIYFTETIDYMICFAIYCGVKELHFAGCDYWHNERWAAERSSTEHWLMEAHLSGIKIFVQPESFLLKLMHRTDCMPNLYGYENDSIPLKLLNEAIDRGRSKWGL